jgi:hypothetical protein
MPLSFEGGKPHFHSLSAWTLNATTGSWTVAPENNWVLNPSFEADRIPVNTPVGWSASSSSNVEDGYSGRWSFQLNGSANLSQGIADLPNGTYTFTVWARSDGAGAELYVQQGPKCCDKGKRARSIEWFLPSRGVGTISDFGHRTWRTRKVSARPPTE